MENVFSKRADSLRPRKRKKARSPALIAKNRSLEDHLEHGDKNNNKGILSHGDLPKIAKK